MDGWKAETRVVECDLPIDTAVERLNELNFEVVERNIGHVVMKRSGTQWTTKGRKFPLELSLAEADDGLFLQLRYDSFAVFDTGDLVELMDEISRHLAERVG